MASRAGDPSSWPSEARGFGFTEAPRGSLGHWIHIQDQKIANYQCVVPSTWNASPRDKDGGHGPAKPIGEGVMPWEPGHENERRR